MIARRKLMAVAAVVDVALHGGGKPVPAKALAGRHGLSPRHLETLLQALVRAGILKGTRGPRGGYELARERRRISAGEILRALDQDEDKAARGGSGLFEAVIVPVVRDAAGAFMATLDTISIADLCRKAESSRMPARGQESGEFHI